MTRRRVLHESRFFFLLIQSIRISWKKECREPESVHANTQGYIAVVNCAAQRAIGFLTENVRWKKNSSTCRLFCTRTKKLFFETIIKRS